MMRHILVFTFQATNSANLDALDVPHRADIPENETSDKPSKREYTVRDDKAILSNRA